jgi:dipeptidase
MTGIHDSIVNTSIFFAEGNPVLTPELQEFTLILHQTTGGIAGFLNQFRDRLASIRRDPVSDLTRNVLIIVCLFACVAIAARADCTNLLVSKGATVDGSVFITYSADSPGYLSHLFFMPAGDHTEGELVDAIGWEDNEVRGQVRQVAHTFGVVGLMNEHQVAIGETTYGGRHELLNEEGMLDYDALIILTLQRAKTAREAIMIMDELCKEYGYGSEGESFSVSDKNEAWLMEIIGKGPGVKGAIWVAARVPDGYITVHANMSRITTFPLNDPDNWLYSPDVIDLAISKGWYDPASGKPFSFREAYQPLDPVSMRVCAARVWSIYRRAAPSQHFSDDFHRGVQGSQDYPLFIKPDKKLTLHDVMYLMRDHFEGTPYDMTKGIDAGPFGSPYRWRGLTWKVDGETYCWERPISSQQAGFVMVCQSRSWLPDPVGGIYWYTADDAYTTAFTPLYCGITEVPKAFTVGTIHKFSWDSAWWVYNLVSNLTYDRWSRIFPDVQKVRDELEGSFLAMMPVIDKTAAELGATDPELMRQYLTTYSVSTGDRLVQRWRELAEQIITKHIDGFVVDEDGESRGVGYPEEWLRRVIKEKPEQFKVPKWAEEK